VIRAYIRNQELADRQLEQFELKISAAKNPIVQTSLKTAFGGSQSNLQLCGRLSARTVPCPSTPHGQEKYPPAELLLAAPRPLVPFWLDGGENGPALQPRW
jgi:hypothetical protein